MKEIRGVLLFVCCMAVLIWPLAQRMVTVEERKWQAIRDQGAAARAAGATATANPYTGEWQSDRGKVWLEGWLDSRAEVVHRRSHE